MNKEFITKWVAALRSGEYQQGFGNLHRVEANTYCCLGVACDLLVKEGVLQSDEGEAYVDIARFMSVEVDEFPASDATSDLLPRTAARHIFGVDIQDYSPVVDGDDAWRECALAEMNDSANWTFSQIADVIEKAYLGDD